MKLSILVCSVHTRYDNFALRILAELFKQYKSLPEYWRDQVEILMLTDTKSMTVGEKRNNLVRMARGEYVVFVDDDDRVEPDYIASLLVATHSGEDIITFRASVTINGGAAKECIYSMNFEQDENTEEYYLRLPNHICAVKRSVAQRAPFQRISRGEDSEYAKRLKPLLRSELAIDRVLYHYDFNSQTTETQR